MPSYSLTHLNDDTLLHTLHDLVARERGLTAEMLAHLAEVDARRLYAPAGFPSMRAYCEGALRLSEQSAYKRITAARLARDFPAIFPMVADGRLNLSGIVLLATHLNGANAEVLLAAAAGNSKAGIERLLAERFPRTESLALVSTLPAAPELSPGRVGTSETAASQLSPGRVAAPESRSTVATIAKRRYDVRLTIDDAAHADLVRAQELFSHAIAPGDLPALFARALKLLVREGERLRHAATSHPQRKARPSANPRHIPAHVKRAVRERDGGRCTFVSDAGHRCEARSHLQFDHIIPIARGGESTVANVRQRCRAHNQYAAECEFGRAFMDAKRRAAKDAAARRAAAKAKTDNEDDRDVVASLRQLGYRVDEARRAAAFSNSAESPTLEGRIRVALSYFRPKTIQPGPALG